MSNTINSFRASKFKLRNVRSVMGIAYVAFAIVLLSGPIRAVIISVAQQGDNPLSADELKLEFDSLISFGVTFAGFFVVLAMSIWVARDYSSGAYQLSNVIAGRPLREVLSRALAASYYVALAGFVSATVSHILGSITLVVATDVGYVWNWGQLGVVVGAIVVLVSAALLGLGIGYVTRSAGLSVFIALTLFAVLPMALITGAFMGYDWMDTLNEVSPAAVMEDTLNESGWEAIVNGAGSLVWALAVLALGALNAKRS